jgi:hypothetical protein
MNSNIKRDTSSIANKKKNYISIDKFDEKKINKI